MPKSPLRLLIISDGRPGHFNLSEGIAAAIARKAQVEITRIEVSRRGWSGLALAALTHARLPAATMLERIYGIRVQAIPPFDLIISAGAETLAGNVWFARRGGVPNLFYGSLRAFSPYDFSLVLTSYPDRANRPRHLFTLKPSRIDPDSLSAPVTRPYDTDWPRTIALLIGGNTHGITYAPADWTAIVNLMRATTATHGTQWLVANSRRTPDDVSDMLFGMAATAPSPIATFLDVRTAGSGTLTQLLARADAIVCTADSSSMLSESIWCRRPTLAISPSQFALEAHERGYRQALASKGACSEHPVASLTTAGLLENLAALEPLRQNPQAQLADHLTTALSGLFAGPPVPTPRAER